MNCDHAWLMAPKKVGEDLIVVMRRCMKCGLDELIWDEKCDIPVDPVDRIIEAFHEVLRHRFQEEWSERAKHPPGLGYPMGGILFIALMKAFEDFGVTLNLELKHE